MTTSNLFKNQTVLIIGINSFVGFHLAKHLKQKGCLISGTYRNQKPELDEEFRLYRYSIEEDIRNLNFTETFDWVIHCSHDTSKNPEIMLSIFKNLESYFSSLGTKQLFISSISALSTATSNYGISKYLIENYFISKHHYIIRPGLIIGKGGLFFKIYKQILKLPFSPLIGEGSKRIEFIGISDLCSGIEAILAKMPVIKEYNFLYPNHTNLKELCLNIKKINNKYFIPIHIPLFIFEFLLLLGEKLKIKLPINKENLEGYKKNSSILYESNTALLGIPNSAIYDTLKNNMD